MSKRAKFVIEQSPEDSQWFFNLLAKNNKVILTSEQYVSKWGAIKGTLSVRANTLFRREFSEFKSTSNGEFYFNLKAGNGEIIGKSEGYKSKAGRANGIASVIYNAPTAWMQFK